MMAPVPTVWFNRNAAPLVPEPTARTFLPDRGRISPREGAVSRRPSARAIASKFSRDPVLSPRAVSTAGTYTVLPIRPCASGYAPVTNDDALTRVTVGNTE